MTATPTTSPNDTTTYDPYASAMSAQERPPVYFGEVVIVDVYACVLEKGIGKRPFDPGRDSVDQRRTNIKIQVAPLRAASFDTTREMLDDSKDWTKFTLPSLRDVGGDLRTLQGKFVQYQLVPTGRTYTSKQDGTTKAITAFVFTALYPDRDVCQAAADAFYGGSGAKGESTDSQNGASPAGTPASAASSPPSPAERQSAQEMLPLLHKAANGDRDAFLAMVKANPIISKYFDAGSPEVCALTGDIPL